MLVNKEDGKTKQGAMSKAWGNGGHAADLSFMTLLFFKVRFNKRALSYYCGWK